MAGIVIKIALEDTHPPVWRRVVVPEHISFYDLHQVIQIVFEWEDVHLHLFEAPKDRYEIIADGEEAYTDFFREKAIPVSAVAERENWIRYVYDMGDEWRHKLTFEKKIEDYDRDYATIIKAKGNSFMEDSGGIWEEMQLTEYDAVMINTLLERKHFKAVTLSGKDKNKLKQIYMMQELQKEVREAVRQSMDRIRAGKADVPYVPEYMPEVSYSQVEQELFDWRQFCGTDDVGAVCKMAPRKTSRELLERMGTEKLLNLEYALYLGEENKPDLPAAERILERFRQHPEYYFCILDEKEMQEFLNVETFAFRQKNEMDEGTVEKGIVLGFWHLQIPEKTQAAYLFPASDFGQRLESLRHVEWKTQYENMQEFSERIKQILLTYCAIEQNALYDVFEKQWKTGMEKQEFLRLVYLNGLIAGKYEIHEWKPSGERLVSVHDLDMDAILSQRMLYAADLDYKQFSAGEMERFSRPLNEVDPQWHIVEVAARECLHMGREDIEHFVTGCYEDVCNGYGVSQILDDMGMYEADIPLVQFCGLWQMLQWTVMNARLPMLNGYSRMEYQNLTRTNAFSLGVFEEEMLADIVETDTELEEMPGQIQEMIYHALFDHRGLEKARALEQVTRKLKLHNDELDILTALAYVDAGKYTKACNILDDVADRTEDESVINAIDTLCDRAENIINNERNYGNLFTDIEMEQPYRRETPKVGRNDPCPCGSGKKYKKCCGK